MFNSFQNYVYSHLKPKPYLYLNLISTLIIVKKKKAELNLRKKKWFFTAFVLDFLLKPYRQHQILRKP